MDATITAFTDADSWNRALYAFLAEKERRSGSRRTVEGYSRMLRHFFGTAGKSPDRVTGRGRVLLGLRCSRWPSARGEAPLRALS